MMLMLIGDSWDLNPLNVGGFSSLRLKGNFITLDIKFNSLKHSPNTRCGT